MNDQLRKATALERLFRTYQGLDKGNTPEEIARNRAAMADVYFEAVSPYTAGDVESAVSAFITGTALGHNPAFAPTAPQVGAQVRREMNQRLDRDRERRPQLPPPDIERTPESQARVRAKMAEAIEGLADKMLTEDAAAAHRRAELQRKTNERFAPDMSPRATAERLGFRYTAGDPEGSEDAA